MMPRSVHHAAGSRLATASALGLLALAACGTPPPGPDAATNDGAPPADRAPPPQDAPTGFDAPPPDDVPAMDDSATDAPPPPPGDASTDAPPPGDGGPDGPRVDRSMPALRFFEFRANEADSMARMALGTQGGALDTRVAPRGRLVVYLHGAGAPTNCLPREHATVLTNMGYHVFAPCYVSNYGVGNCGTNIGGCRLEAFEGTDQTPVITIAPPDSIERRIVRGLQLLQMRNPGGDWRYYLDGDRPRWSAIIISGISHGASTSGLIGLVRPAARVVMLSGPLDTGQAWLRRRPYMTPIDQFWGFTHTGDEQHMGHLQSFMDLGVPGAPVTVDGMTSPYGGSHRLRSSAPTRDGHGSTQAGGSSPRDAMGNYQFLPVWRLMYGAM